MTPDGFSRSTVPAIALALILLWSGCDAFKADDDESGIVTLSGQVLNDLTNNPVAGAVVRVSPFDLVFETDAEGNYLFDVEIDSTMDLDLKATSSGFTETTLSVIAIAGRTIEVPEFRIFPLAGETRTSGKASNILLLEQSGESIGVKESGSEEVATLTFQLADSSGNPVVLDKKALVNFRFGVRPGGGEFLSPTEAQTDNNGVAVVHLSSGTTAGTVQVIAETVVDGITIRSQPVAVAIHGGLPDQTHFSLGPVRRNFPGLVTIGLINTMSVIVGDKWSNPVRTGTSVSFRTSHGVIEGSALTNGQGQGSVALIAANPLPADGIAHITATTADENQNLVTSTTPVVFSGVTTVTVSPSTAQRNTTYTLVVDDPNGNPLVGGSSITVQAGGTAVQAVGATEVTIDDTVFSGGINFENVVRGPGWTEFTFRIVDDIDPQNPQTPIVEAVSIRVASENGNLDVVLSPGSPAVMTDGASMRMSGSDTFEIVAPNFERH